MATTHPIPIGTRVRIVSQANGGKYNGVETTLVGYWDGNKPDRAGTDWSILNGEGFPYVTHHKGVPFELWSVDELEVVDGG